jgi:hypothetical protein
MLKVQFLCSGAGSQHNVTFSLTKQPVAINKKLICPVQSAVGTCGAAAQFVQKG